MTRGQEADGMPDRARPVRYEIRSEAMTRAELQALGWSDSDMHERPWPTAVHAYAIDHAGARRPVRHHARHSPTGFDFGYAGSGPAELARCLLIDLYNVHDLADNDLPLGGRDPLPVSYQEFKRAFIARLDRGQTPHHPVSDIEAWAREQSYPRPLHNDQQ